MTNIDKALCIIEGLKYQALFSSYCEKAGHKAGTHKDCTAHKTGPA